MYVIDPISLNSFLCLASCGCVFYFPHPKSLFLSETFFHFLVRISSDRKCTHTHTRRRPSHHTLRDVDHFFRHRSTQKGVALVSIELKSKSLNRVFNSEWPCACVVPFWFVCGVASVVETSSCVRLPFRVFLSRTTKRVHSFLASRATSSLFCSSPPSLIISSSWSIDRCSHTSMSMNKLHHHLWTQVHLDQPMLVSIGFLASFQSNQSNSDTISSEHVIHDSKMIQVGILFTFSNQSHRSIRINPQLPSPSSLSSSIH